MEKEPQPESLAAITIKPDYPPSEVYSSEPPPAYHRNQSSAVQVAKIVAVTVVLVSFVLGGFLLASAYVSANASCRQLEQELELLSEAADRFQAPLQPEALIQEEPLPIKRHTTNEKSKEPSKEVKEMESNSVDDNSDGSSDISSSEYSEESDDIERTPIHFKLPLQLDFDDLAGALIEKNQKSRMNCIVEKKRAEEVVDHQPKTVNLPFGVNLTTDPRYERLTGERMAIFCESGNMQRTQPQEEEQPDQEDTIMIQPVMIPIPQGHFPSHMPQQLPPQMMHQFQAINEAQQQMEPMHRPVPQQQPQQPQEFPPNPILHHIAQQIIAQKIMEAQKASEDHQSQESSQQDSDQRIPLPEEILSQLNRLPNRDVIVVSEQDTEEPQEMRVVQEQRRTAQGMNGRQTTYPRGLLVPIQVTQQPHDTPHQTTNSEQTRPHFVQPRSVRSVDALLPKSQKRVKRCACNCAC